MSNYRRFKTSGGTYFFTVATYNRQEILCKPQSRNALRDAIEAVRALLPFHIDAWVLLPDYLHCIWTLPEGDADFSKRWGTIKTSFTKKVGWALPTNKIAMPTNKKYSISRIRHRDANIWQRRFWEHQIRDQEDFNRHCDYIHYNPVKHGLVGDPKKWEYSTIHRFIQKGLYSKHWGDSITDDIISMGLE